jgi:cytochrome P450
MRWPNNRPLDTCQSAATHHRFAPPPHHQVYEVRQYPKSPRYMDLLPIVGPQSMLLTEGHVWKSQREAFNPGQH